MRLDIYCPVTGKRVYATLFRAQEEMHRIAKRSASEHVPIRAYRCKHCDWWHLTSHEYRPGPQFLVFLGGIA
jgi:hypothetical protein